MSVRETFIAETDRVLISLPRKVRAATLAAATNQVDSQMMPVCLEFLYLF